MIVKDYSVNIVTSYTAFVFKNLIFITLNPRKAGCFIFLVII